MTRRQVLDFLAAFLGPPLFMTGITVVLGLTYGDHPPPWVDALSFGFFIVLIPGFYFLAREVRPLERPVRGLVIALVYFYAMFWVTIGSAFYLGIFILGALGEPVSF
ncbi:MAG: hypothetical protein AB7N65_28065 [Vicinamibacterales bacterium]